MAFHHQRARRVGLQRQRMALQHLLEIGVDVEAVELEEHQALQRCGHIGRRWRGGLLRRWWRRCSRHFRGRHWRAGRRRCGPRSS
jgi:hypothetical protein